MARREEALALLRRWIRQQRREGLERYPLDRELISTAAAMAVADGPSPPTPEPEPASRPAPEPPSAPRAATADLAARWPEWAGSELLPLAGEVLACRNCGLAETRAQAVPGTGSPRAKLVLVGEAPGAEEDRQGIPFVGRGGQLLDKILAAIDLKREDVHILNILKCRPPGNRNPAPDEIVACRPYLERQLEIIQPGIIVALGLFAAQWLTGKKLSLTKLRQGGPHEYAGIRVFPTYHPAALLRNPNWKRPAWEDFQAIRKEYDRL